jgi:stage II sporulation protein AB (anti-sigma F factor)
MDEFSTDQSKPHLQLTCQVDASLLSLLRDFVCNCARHLQFTEPEVAEIEISVDEACANAMEHAYPPGMPPASYEVTVDIFLNSDQMTIKIHDRGFGEHKRQQPMDTMDDYLDATRDRFRGLGFLLMRKFMDKVEVVTRPGEGTTVEMTKIKR